MSDITADTGSETPETVDISTDNESDAPESLDTGSETVESTESGDPYAEWGGKDRVAAAVRLHEAASSEEGVIQLFFETGRNLGLGLKDLERLFGGDRPESEPEDLDRPLTAKEFQDFLAKQRDEEATRGRQSFETQARQTIQTTMTELGVEAGSETARLVLEMGDKYLKNDLTPEAVTNAVRRGHADYQAFIDKEAKAYLARKRAAGKAVPGAPVGASAPAAPPPEEPKNIAEAIAMARKRYLSPA